jgi:O-antigen/teichoic acid export membrane protein
VGYFGMARDIGTVATTEMVMPINRAAFPGYSRIANDLPRLREGFLKLLAAIAMVVLPAGIGVAVTAELIVTVFLGPRWLPAVPAMQLLSVYGAIHGLQSNTNAAYLAIGRPRLQTVRMLVFIAVLVPGLLVLTPRLAQTGAALACLLAAAVAVPMNLLNVSRCLGIRAGELFGALWRPLLGSTVMAIAVWAILSVLPEADSVPTAALLLATGVVVGALTYGLMILGLWWASGRPDGSERWLLDRITARLRRSRNL